MDKQETREIICNGYIFTLVPCNRAQTDFVGKVIDQPCFMNNKGWVLNSVIKEIKRGN